MKPPSQPALSDAEPIPYNRFAKAYDEMMEHVDYEGWVRYILMLFDRYNVQPVRALDLGCGTGQIAVPLAQKGYSIVGVDRAPGMLQAAREKADQAGVQIEWIEADMRGFTLNEPCGAALCLYDSINYMRSEDELRQTFQQVRNALKPGGIFLFDIISEKNITSYFDRKTFSENRPDYTFIWKNRYTQFDKTCRTELTFFYREGNDFKRYIETHVQRIFEVREVKQALKQTGFQFLDAFAAWTTRKYDRMSDRINIAARKPA